MVSFFLNSKLKILVTGGAGFIGGSLLRYLIKYTNHSVINVDKLTYAGNLRSIEGISKSPRYLFEKIDICDFKELKKVFDIHQPDIVMHLAAESHVDRSIMSPYPFIKTNILGTYSILEICREYWSNLGIEKKSKFRFLHISTDEVYGDLPHPDFHENGHILFSEKTPYNPSSPYSSSKASSDHLVRSWFRTYGLPTIITNCSNNYGPYHFPEKLIPRMILNAIDGKDLPIYSKGEHIRDWLYVEDHVSALILVASKGRIGETYNIGGNNEKRNIDVVRLICSTLEDLVPIKKSSLNISSYDKLITFVKDRPGHDMRYAIDSSKIKIELGWSPKESFESGIHKTVKWYLENKPWCQDVLNK